LNTRALPEFITVQFFFFASRRATPAETGMALRCGKPRHCEDERFGAAGRGFGTGGNAHANSIMTR
jgi:hypothetical protein